MKPLDFVMPYTKGTDTKPQDYTKVGIITEVSEPKMYTDGKMHVSASVEWIGGSDGLKSAWWDEKDLVVIDSLPNLLAKGLAHPFGNGAKQVDTYFPLDNPK